MCEFCVHALSYTPQCVGVVTHVWVGMLRDSTRAHMSMCIITRVLVFSVLLLLFLPTCVLFCKRNLLQGFPNLLCLNVFVCCF